MNYATSQIQKLVILNGEDNTTYSLVFSYVNPTRKGALIPPLIQLSKKNLTFLAFLLSAVKMSGS